MSNNKSTSLVPSNPEIIVDIEVSFEDRAKVYLLEGQYNDLIQYIDKGGHEIALSTAQKFFELFLNGESIEEIHRLNPAFPIAAIHWLRIKYCWDKMKTDYIMALQKQTAEKAFKAQLEVTSLYSDILSAAVKKHGAKIKKYLQTGNEQDLGEALAVDSLHQLMKAAEALQKITGQDRNIKIKKEETLDLNVRIATEGDGLSPEASAKILSVVAEEKRKKEKK